MERFRAEVPDSERDVEIKSRKTDYRLRAEKMDGTFPVSMPPHGTSLRALAPLLVNCRPLKRTMLFRWHAATRQPPGCCVFSPSEPPCVLTQASWFPRLWVPSSGTVSTSPNGAESLVCYCYPWVCVPQALPRFVHPVDSGVRC
jgi:hypothetical protein